MQKQVLTRTCVFIFSNGFICEELRVTKC